MKESIGKKILFSKFSKFWICAALIISIISFFWDLYKFYFLELLSTKRIYSDVVLIGVFYVLFKTVVKESSHYLNFLRSKVGIILSWTVIIVFVMYEFNYPINVISSLFLLSVPALHYSIRYFGKKKIKPD